MGHVDSGMSDLPLYALPIALVIVIAAIPRGIMKGRRTRESFAFMHRAPGDARPGPGHFEVETIGSEPTNLGHSSESKTPSGTPLLVCDPAILKIVGGPRIRLGAGSKLIVTSLAGAKRRTVDTTTTPTGVANKISFEVPPGTRFWLTCDLAEGGGTPAVAYRDDVVLETRPIGEYVVTTTIPAAPRVMGAAIGHAIAFSFFGLFVGFMVTMAWRTGCANGRFPIPLAALVDALSIGVVLGAVGVHAGVGSVIPGIARKMTKKDGAYVLK